jgi:hypothetical protein
LSDDLGVGTVHFVVFLLTQHLGQAGCQGPRGVPFDRARGIVARNPLKVQEARDQRRRDKSGTASLSASHVDQFVSNRIHGVEPKGFGPRGPGGPAPVFLPHAMLRRLGK